MPNGYDHPHFHIRFKGKKEAYKSRHRVVPPTPPTRDRQAHAAHLQEQYSSAIAALANRYPDAEGFYLRFTVPEDQEHIVESLENQKRQIEVLAVKPESDGATTATVFVPEAQQNFFPTKFHAYSTRDTKTGRPQK